LAETLWSPIQNKSWGNFIWKVEDHFDYFESQNLNISKAVYEPIVKVMKEGDALRLKLENHVPGIEIYYTTDNTYPVNFGNKYEEPIIIPDADLHLRVQSFRNGNPLGRMIILSKEELETRAK
jgi:hexosaminidase